MDREKSTFKIEPQTWKSQGQIFQIEWVACLWVNFWNMTHVQKSPEKYVLLTFHVKIILDLQKGYKGVQSSYLPFYLASTDIILYNHSIIIQTRKWTLI